MAITKGVSVLTHNGEDLAINDANVAHEFDAASAYAIGDHVTYCGKLYCFHAPHAANAAWDYTKVREILIGDEVTAVKNNLTVPFDETVSYSAGWYTYYQPDQALYRFTVDHAAGPWSYSHVVRVTVGDEIIRNRTETDSAVADLKSALNDMQAHSATENKLDFYLYKRNAYINASGVLTPLTGVVLFRVPIKAPSFFIMKWDGEISPFDGISDYTWLEDDQGGLIRATNSNGLLSNTNKYKLVVPKNDTVAIYFNTNLDTYKQCDLFIGGLTGNNPHAVDVPGGIQPINKETFPTCRAHWGNNTFVNLSSGVYSSWMRAKAGDKVEYSLDILSSLSYIGRFIAIDGTVTTLSTTGTSFECPSDGVLYLLNLNDNISEQYFIPKNQNKTNVENVQGLTEYADSHIGSAMTSLALDTIGLNSILSQYLDREGAYFFNGVYTEDSKFNVYKVPMKLHDVVTLYTTDGSDYAGAGGLNNGYSLMMEEDGIYYLCTSNNNRCVYSQHMATAMGRVASSNLYINVYKNELPVLVFGKNTNGNTITNGQYLKPNDMISSVKRFALKTSHYLNIRSPYNFTTLTGMLVYSLHVSEGDKLVFSSAPPSVSFYGSFLSFADESVVTRITSLNYTVPSDGIAFVFIDGEDSIDCTIYPAETFKVDYKDIVNTPEADNRYNGLQAVAFGTSLTYRAQTTGGFLQYLPGLSGMIVDNQGIGSSKIKGNMLTAIKNYASFANKNVCLLEGFVNDWYQNMPLGEWTDSTEDTVCGCVRVALTHIVTQNQTLTVFLILDHYGKGISATTEVNESNLTQYEYYEEIAKVAESLGIPVIKEYALSQISEYAPQYLLDNIHMNDLGAHQSANVIWSVMKQHYPNALAT